MMAPEEMEEKRHVNHTPTIALTVAAVLLLIVAALSFKDYVRSSLEKEFEEKERQLLARHGYPIQAYQGQPTAGVNQQGMPQQPGMGVPPQGGMPQVQGNYPPQGMQQPIQQQAAVPDPSMNNALLAQQAAQMGVESSLSVPADPEIDSIQKSLDQARLQSQRTEQQYKDLVSGASSVVPPAGAANPNAEVNLNELPDFLKEAVANPPGGNPSIEEELRQMRSKIQAAPALATVTSYDTQWGFVTFNAGAGQGVTKDQRFAVRRGDTILGWIKVDEVQANQSIAVLVTKNRDIDTAEKPAAGDDLINFELF